MNYTNIFHNSWIYNTETNTHIIYILDEYTKDRNTSPDNYITADEKPVKINSYKMFIITVNIPNGLNTITLADTAYCPTFFTNIISTKHFQLKKIYLDKEHNQLHKKKIT